MRTPMKSLLLFSAIFAAVILPVTSSCAVDADIKSENGKYFTKFGQPTYRIEPDGTVDWYTYSGFRRYHSVCHMCHGPEALGSTFGPALIDSLKTMSYEDFQTAVINGRQKTSAAPVGSRLTFAAQAFAAHSLLRPVFFSAQDSIMPSFGIDRNVMCYLDDIYVYLKARADGVLPAGRPAKHAAQSQTAKDYENKCMQ